jgi:hypothetical protein
MKIRKRLKQKGKKPGPGWRGDPTESRTDCHAKKPPIAIKKIELPISEVFMSLCESSGLDKLVDALEIFRYLLGEDLLRLIVQSQADIIQFLL